MTVAEALRQETMDADGNVVQEARYLPYGQVR
jgi:hypothetical protein